VLDNGLFQTRFEYVMPTWQEALKAYLSERGLLH
jgi:dTDP-4-dehydrorhamnose reductase